MSIRRFSSRTHRLDASFLMQHLAGARSYKRIAGYFTSSLFEVAGEALEHIPEVKIVCNVDIHPDDLKVAQLRESKMLGRWNERALEAEALLNRERYRRLDAFLAKHGQAVRIAPDDICGFVHGKAGVITLADGRKLGFIGSMNETRNGWQRHYEILWEDESPEGVAWIEEEFDFLWNAAKPLPQAVIREVHRRGYRREIEFVEIDDDENLAPAALIESPLYREGQQLQPWQQGFLTECLHHQRLYGTVRLLLADEVGLGKTLSLATAALTLCLLSDKENGPRRPVVIFAPATLTEQWQTEMLDKLGIPTARWDTVSKVWLDADERVLSPAGREQIAHCPLRIGIVSTGLMMRDSLEKQHLLGMRFGVVILDEAHKARTRQGFGKEAGTPNELLAFMREIAARADHVLLGTATPIQTNPADLWDLLGILHQGPGRFVLGHDLAPWHRPDEVLDILAGRVEVESLTHAWELLRSPLPRKESTSEPRARRLFSAIRQDLGLQNGEWQTNSSLADLTEETREILEEELERRIAGATLFQRENPLVRHVVLRKRQQLEDAGLLARVGVDVHPEREQVSEQRAFDALFEGKALRTSEDFRQAYGEARAFGKALAKRGKGSGFMKNLMEQRICSSIHAGLATARRLLQGGAEHEEDEEQEADIKVETSEEIEVLQRLIVRLERLQVDPKMEAVVHFLDKEKWLELGVIIFSQYYDTAKWLADSLAARYPEEAVGLYAGAGRSRLYQRGDSVSVERETLKRMVAEHQIRVMVATDAACEGLNLQTLGTLINVDLPWNPTRLEQRIGRIKRFGQRRETVDMLNLVFEQTVDEKIYERLSERMKNRYDLFGSLPDTIKDEWIDDIETLGERLDEYINAQKTATGFDLRYTGTMMPPEKDWREFTEVLSRHDLVTLMSAAWG
ncbi:phospholipase D-like domain-containing anti-phage protein [Achromobacter xylosoxidans]|uniref:phospholipase D-like domain-containing anti-phage protein n=1 Tax=Alcaligenes xylosoxydans xylosoxydans TaxID=85698 RepID=UPI0006C03AB0|nr:phospholipase D-like domain-containing anti-phage protein [Achromobacter xylosoxidans]MDH0521864.1 phospholipase D-like domain-containing protein [Achromobacter xylosoxidans]MDZ5618191.1 phospholipase D-like domain-containing anti-phage protein [Achromobacter xylosoxidans]MDZ5623824.1 phospholipase D-like domain-containing anti-phage protein [Achromobacter xylosoxidans]MDZ5684306.1 phospholipase D-like domain-containing anti-phage protein [Achromobacter xylosoxidans]CUJ21191.1 RNA polymeras